MCVHVCVWRGRTWLPTYRRKGSPNLVVGGIRIGCQRQHTKLGNGSETRKQVHHSRWCGWPVGELGGGVGRAAPGTRAIRTSWCLPLLPAFAAVASLRACELAYWRGSMVREGCAFNVCAWERDRRCGRRFANQSTRAPTTTIGAPKLDLKNPASATTQTPCPPHAARPSRSQAYPCSSSRPISASMSLLSCSRLCSA
jgi:hypothetical protein